MSKIFLKIVFFFLLVFLLFLIKSEVLAEDCTEENEGEIQNCGECGWKICECWYMRALKVCGWSSCYEASYPSCEDQEWDEYKCRGQCEAGKFKRHVREDWEWEDCTCQGDLKDRYWDCTNCRLVEKIYTPDEEGEKIGNCEVWQKCEPGFLDWKKSDAAPVCECEGGCLEAPKNPRYYDNPEISWTDKDYLKYLWGELSAEDLKRLELYLKHLKDGSNIYLPVKLDWSDVKGWKDGWVSTTDNKILELTCSEECVNSYVLRIEETNKGEFEKILDKSEFATAPEEFCLLKSNFTHNWHVKACCNSDGTNCDRESDWQLKTNLPPEPVEPYDPDWNGPETGYPIWYTPSEENPLPVHFKWCSVAEAQSYGIRAYKDEIPYCPEFFCPIIITKTTKKPIDTLEPEVDFDLDSFTKETYYQWKVATCLSDEGRQCSLDCPEDRICYSGLDDPGCGLYSQLWSFFGEVRLPIPELVSPKDGEFVNLTHSLQWKHVSGAKSYRYELGAFPPTPVRDFVSLRDLWNKRKLALDTEYTWRVQPCWDEEGLDCQKESWSEKWKFTTTGAPPKILDADATIIPVKLDWEDIPGALSYKYEVVDLSTNKVVAEGVIYSLEGVPLSEILIDYPNLKQERNYSWRVKTCADEEGKVCGIWSVVKEFRTFKLATPTNPHPKDGGEFFTYENYISWDSVLGARFYQYKIDFLSLSSEETKEKCPPLVGREVVSKIVSATSTFVSLECLGKYKWQVQACLDKDCQENSDWSGPWYFTLIQAPEKGGLVPCGRNYDDPDTPWNEREKCGIKHIFILLKVILDFLFWKVAPIILVLLVILTAVVFYLSLGAPATIVNVKALWKSAGIGYAIIFLAWTFVNLLLKILGITTEWWVLPF